MKQFIEAVKEMLGWLLFCIVFGSPLAVIGYLLLKAAPHLPD